MTSVAVNVSGAERAAAQARPGDVKSNLSRVPHRVSGRVTLWYFGPRFTALDVKTGLHARCRIHRGRHAVRLR